MITEIAQIDVKPGTEAEFENGVKQAVPLFKRAKGCRSMEVRRSTEKPSRYRLFVGWDTVENHTVDFRGSADFQEWRKLVAHCFAAPPDVEHVTGQYFVKERPVRSSPASYDEQAAARLWQMSAQLTGLAGSTR